MDKEKRRSFLIILMIPIVIIAIAQVSAYLEAKQEAEAQKQNTETTSFSMYRFHCLEAGCDQYVYDGGLYCEIHQKQKYSEPEDTEEKDCIAPSCTSKALKGVDYCRDHFLEYILNNNKPTSTPTGRPYTSVTPSRPNYNNPILEIEEPVEDEDYYDIYYENQDIYYDVWDVIYDY